jgi:hypothetical protein
MAELQERKQLQQKKRSRDDAGLEVDELPSEEEKAKVARLEAADDSEALTATETDDKNETTAAVEENLLETALDTLRRPDDDDDDEGTGGGEKRVSTADEEADLLNDDGYESDENVVGYIKDDVRQGAFQQKIIPKLEENKMSNVKVINTRCLPVSEELALALELLGMPIVPDNEVEVIGAVPPVISPPPAESSNNVLKKFSLLENFDIVELDENGHVIDKGDENFTPSNSWTGRKPGFEFKLGERGLGYYRTGKKVMVPSNMAY